MERNYYLQKETNDKQDTSSFDINHAVDQLANMYDKYVDLKEVQESHITQRRQIAAEERTALEKIRANTYLIDKYLEKSFKDRSENSDRWFKQLDKAIETNNMEMIGKSCEAIVDLGRSNPLSHIAELGQSRTRKFLESDEEIDL